MINLQNNKKFDVYALGNALTDILAKVSDEYISSHNIEKGIMTLTEESKQKEILRSLTQEDIETKLACGGSACNTLAGLNSLGGSGNFCGKIAKDDYGNFYKSGLKQSGISYNVSAGEGLSGTSLILVSPDAERTMLTNLGASTTLSKKDLNKEDIINSKILYIEGYLWDAEEPRKACIEAMEIAKANDITIAFTISDPFLISRFYDDFRSIVKKYVDILFCNEEEARTYASTDNSGRALKEISEHADFVFMTRGADGSSVAVNNEIFDIDPIKVQAIDTVGAGDAYAAGVLYSLTQGYNPKQAAGVATILSARVVATVGPRLDVDLKNEVKEFLRSSKYPDFKL